MHADESLPWRSDDTDEPPDNQFPVSFCTQLSGEQKNIGICHVYS